MNLSKTCPKYISRDYPDCAENWNDFLREVEGFKNLYMMNKTIRRIANAIARSKGYGVATKIIFGDENKVISHTSYGYRKYTTGEYVSNAYRNKFGWKNTYYQHALTEVMVKPSFGMAAFCAGLR